MANYKTAIDISIPYGFTLRKNRYTRHSLRCHVSPSQFFSNFSLSVVSFELSSQYIIIIVSAVVVVIPVIDDGDDARGWSGGLRKSTVLRQMQFL